MMLIANASQAMLRGVVPDSFPSQLAPSPNYGVATRRFIIMDQNVYDLHGEKVEKVCIYHSRHQQENTILRRLFDFQSPCVC